MRRHTVTGYDVFLCYKYEDLDLAMPLKAAIERAGASVFLDVIEGEDFAPLAASIEAALLAAKTLVALVTPRFPTSPHCRDELHTALTAAYYLDAGETSRVMAVTRGVSPDDVRPRQLTTLRLPPDGRPLDELAATIAGRANVATVPFGAAPARPDPRWYPQELPNTNRFQGRAAEVWELHEALRGKEKNRTREHPVVLVRGPGGIGKTALCLQYARWFHRDHPGGVFVLRLGGSSGGRVTDSVIETRFAEQLTLIAASLGVDGPGDVASALDRLAQPYLWIVDDLPAAAPRQLVERLCAPTRHGRTLLTSRGRVSARELVLQPVDTRTGHAVLTAYRAPRDAADSRSARDVVDLLSGHALGLTLAAGLTTLPDFTDYHHLLTQLASSEPDRLEAAAALLRDELPAACAQPFASALLRNFTALGDPAREMLYAASVLAPVEVPVRLLTGTTRRLVAAGTDTLDDGLAQAVRSGLLDRGGPDGYLMHAMVARAIRAWVYPASRRARLRDAALAELTDAVESTSTAYHHRAVLPLLPHVRAIAGIMTGGDPWHVGEDERHLLNETGRVQVEAGETGHALATFQALRDVCRPGTVDAVTAHVVTVGLAVAYEAEGAYATALRLKLEALDGLARALGPDHPDTLTARNNVAVTHIPLKDYAAAHRLLADVYRRRRDHPDLGPTHRDTLTALGNLAIVRGRLGTSAAEQAHHHRVAHRYWTASQERWRRIAGPRDPRLLDVRNGLALNLRALGRLDEALQVAVTLSADRAALLGPDHPDTLGSLENEIIIRQELSGPDAATFHNVLARRMANRPAHPSTRVTLANLLRQELSPAPAQPVVRQPAFLPDGIDVTGVRLDGEHVDDEIDVQQAAIALQQQRVDTFGPDDPHTFSATAYLAYALALGNHLDGQLETAAVLAQDAADGLADAAERGEPVDPDDLATAQLINGWIGARLAQDES